MLLEYLLREEIYSLLGIPKDGFWFVDTPLGVYLILNVNLLFSFFMQHGSYSQLCSQRS